MFSLSAILNGNKWLLCPQDGEFRVLLTRCTGNVGRAPAGTATWIITPPMDVVQQAGICAGRHGAGVGAAWSQEAMAPSVPGSGTRQRLRRRSASERGRGWLLLGQQSAPVGLHLLQPLHQVAVADLQLLGFVQC